MIRQKVLVEECSSPLSPFFSYCTRIKFLLGNIESFWKAYFKTKITSLVEENIQQIPTLVQARISIRIECKGFYSILYFLFYQQQYIIYSKIRCELLSIENVAVQTLPIGFYTLLWNNKQKLTMY